MRKKRACSMKRAPLLPASITLFHKGSTYLILRKWYLTAIAYFPIRSRLDLKISLLFLKWLALIKEIKLNTFLRVTKLCHRICKTTKVNKRKINKAITKLFIRKVRIQREIQEIKMWKGIIVGERNTSGDVLMK